MSEFHSTRYYHRKYYQSAEFITDSVEVRRRKFAEAARLDKELAVRLGGEAFERELLEDRLEAERDLDYLRSERERWIEAEKDLVGTRVVHYGVEYILPLTVDDCISIERDRVSHDDDVSVSWDIDRRGMS